MKKLLLFLLLVPLAFAASWQEIAVLSMMVSVSLLALIFGLGQGFQISELQLMAKEEMFQLLALALMIAVLFGADGFINSFSTTFSPTSDTMQKASLDIIDENKASVANLINVIGDYDLTVSKESSKSTQCNIQGQGYSVSACGGYSMIAPPLSMAGGIAGFAMGELSALQRLVQLADRYALSLLLPIGILLRTFKVTRGGGGFLIALGISLHIMLPVGIIFNEMLGETFQASTDSGVSQYPRAPSAPVNIEGCDPADVEPSDKVKIVSAANIGSLGGSNEDKAVKGYLQMRKSIRENLYIILVKATLGPILALLLMAASLRALTSLAGAEVDVSAIARLV